MNKVEIRVGGCYAMGRTHELQGVILKIIKETDTDYKILIYFKEPLTIPKTVFNSLIESNGIIEIDEEEGERISVAVGIAYH